MHVLEKLIITHTNFFLVKSLQSLDDCFNNANFIFRIVFLCFEEVHDFEDFSER